VIFLCLGAILARMATQIWFRNPGHYIKEIIECGELNIVFDGAYAKKRNIDPVEFCEMYYGNLPHQWRVQVVSERGATEYTSYQQDKPVAVYPVWSGEVDTLDVLETMMANPVGEDLSKCTNKEAPEWYRPVYGQEHRVVVADLPSAVDLQGKQFYRSLRDLQLDYPECLLHIHGSWGISTLLGLGFGSFDLEARTHAAKKRVYLPNGKVADLAHINRFAKWVHLMGFTIGDLNIPRNRCIFTIKSVRWACNNSEKNLAVAFRSDTYDDGVDITSPDLKFTPKEIKNPKKYLTILQTPQPGDKVECDTCSLQVNCRYYREGSVCTVPGSELSPLARQFQTRDSGVIIEGLSRIVAMEADRFERAYQEEEDFGLDPEVTKMSAQVYRHAIDLAKLVDPALRVSPQVAVQINNGKGSNEVTVTRSPREIADAAVKALLAQGYRMEELTEDMIKDQIEKQNNSDPKQIEGQVVNG
jgi:hypothetical protein